MVERIELQTKRLLLRPFALADVGDVLRYSANATAWRYYSPQPRSRQSAEQFVTQQVEFPTETEVWFAIILEQTVIGEISLSPMYKADWAEIGYAIVKDHWGQGLTTEAAEAIVDWGFDVLGLQRIQARSDVPNVASWRIMEKLGMQREGVMRKKDVVDGERVDVVFYGLLREEWEANR